MSTENIENTENIDELGISDRGVGVQAVGFTVVAFVSLAILQLFSGSEYWLYLWFETAVTRLYWAFVVPLAALFDWGRIMFAKGKAIREAKLREIRQAGMREGLERGMQQGMQQGIAQTNAKWRALAEKYGIPENELPFADDDA